MNRKDDHMEKLGKASKFTAFITIAGVLIILLSLFLSSRELAELQKKKQDLIKSTEDLTISIEEKKKTLSRLKTEFDKADNELNEKITTILDASFKLDKILKSIESNQSKKQIDEVSQKLADIKLMLFKIRNPCIYIHTQEESQILIATQLSKIFEEIWQNEYNVPEIEPLKDEGPEKTEIRYFEEGQENSAKKVKGILLELGFKDISVVYDPKYEDSKAFGKNQFEIWFGSDINEEFELDEKPIPSVDSITPLIYLQIRSEKQKSKASQVSKILNSKDYNVPGIELLTDKGPDNTEVRYFREIEETLAEQILNVLKENGLNESESVYIPGYENSTTLRKKQFEIWFGPEVE